MHFRYNSWRKAVSRRIGISWRAKCNFQLYHVDNKKGKTYMAFSSDSSCTQDLDNSTSGYETLILSKSTNQKMMPNYVKEHVATWVRARHECLAIALIANEHNYLTRSRVLIVGLAYYMTDTVTKSLTYSNRLSGFQSGLRGCGRSLS